MSGKNFLDKLLDGGEFQTKPLGELGTFIRGSGIQKSDFTESGAGCIHYGQIHTHYGTWATETKSFISHDLAARLRKAHTGDLVIATTSEDDDAVAKAVAWLGEEAVAVSTDAYIYRHTANPKYMSYFFQTEFFQSQKKPYITGTKVRRISGDSLAKIQIPIPCPDNPKKSLEIQAEIVRILDAFTAMTAELTAELTARKKQYNYYRDKLLSFEEGEVEWKVLGESAEIFGGLTGKTKSDFETGDAKYVPYRNIFSNIAVDFGAIERVQVFQEERQNAVRYGDVLFTASSETAEEAGMSSVVLKHMEEPVYLNSFAFGVRFHPDVPFLPDFTKHLFRSSAMRSEIVKTASGVTRFNISKERFKKIRVPVPSLAEQAKIAAILDKFDALTNSITEGLPREIELRQKQYEYYRDLLLSFPKPQEVEA